MKLISNNHLKEIARLKQKKFRNSSDKVLVEGLRTIDHLIKNNVQLDELYISETMQQTYSHFCSKNTFILKDSQFPRISATKTPQHIAALTTKKILPITETGFLLYLDSLSEPGNIGTIIRTAAAAGISGVILSPDSCDVFNPKVLRASMGSVLTFPVEYRDKEWLQQQNSSLIATTVENAENLFEFSRPAGDLILIIGSESEGIDQQILDRADHRVQIPITEGIESLNAAIAAGISIYSLLNQDKHE